MTTLKMLAYIVLQIVLLPICIFGFVMVGIPQVLGSKKLGLSGTAVDVLQTRWIQHYFGDRPDPTTIALAEHLPNMSHAGMWLALSAVALSHRIFGYVPGVLRVPTRGDESFLNFFYTRHQFFDEVFSEEVAAADQVVFMGAGFDTRAFMFCQRDDVVVFELDQPNMQQVKRDALAAAGLDANFIRFVPVNFNQESWSERLVADGFDRNKNTIFLWEGVTLYLDESEVRSTLESLASLGSPGSIVALDLYSTDFLQKARKSGGRVYEGTTGEKFGFGLDFSKSSRPVVETLLRDVNLSVERIEFPGEGRRGKEPIVALVQARVAVDAES